MKIDKVYFSLGAVVLFSALLWISSCRHVSLIPSDIPVICFDKEVLTIFRTSCGMANCHDGSGEPGSDYNYYPDIRRDVVPGDPYASPVYRAMIKTWGENKMPPSEHISQENRMIIRLWIEQGANPTVCPDTIPQPITSSGLTNPKRSTTPGKNK